VSPTDRLPRRSATAAAARGAAVLLAASLLLAACGGGEDEAGWAEPDVAVRSMPAPMPMAPDAGYDAGVERAPAMGGGTGGAVADVTGRAVVRNAFLDLVVDDGAVAVDAAIAIAEAAGGYVAGTYLSRGEDGTVSGTLTLRVPADRLDEVVEQLDDLARAVPTRSVDEYDVSDQLRDLDAQLENLRAYETELRALLTEVRQRSGSAEDLLAVSDRLRQVRTEIDMFEGMRRQLTQQVALSTVTVSITPARAATPVAGAWDLPGVVRDALAALVTTGRWLVEAGIWVVVVGLPALLGLWVLRRVWRGARSRRRAGTGTGTGTPTS
jgi:hypothetical protein